MPNGHGGFPFLGSPILFAALFIALVQLPMAELRWLYWLQVTVCLLLAALVGWRLAYHLHMRHADGYGGAYTSAEVYRRALLRYWALAVLYTTLSTVGGFAILLWRGLA